MSRRRMIWLTILALMVIGWWNDKLDLFRFLLLIFVGHGLVRMFDPDEAKAPSANPVRDEDSAPEDSDPADVLLIRRGTVKSLRNILLRAHNARTTDRDYQASAEAKEATRVIQALNSALAGKQRRLPAE